MKPVPLVYSEIGNQGMRKVACMLRSGTPHRGETGKQLEITFAKHTGTGHAVALNSGTAALQLALQAHGIGPGHEVIIPPLCLPAVPAAVLSTGAEPVLADIDPYTYTISPPEVVRIISERTRAVLAIHLFGQPCEMDRLAGIAKEHGLVLIEVAWEALGARYHNMRIGTHGTSCYSFPEGISAVAGHGGMLTTNNEQVAEAVRCMANYGCDHRGQLHGAGCNYSMTDITAALALDHLPRADSRAKLQEYWAMELTHALKEWKGLVTPAVLPGARHAFQRYAVRVSPEFPLHLSTVCQELDTLGIESACRPLVPLHRHPWFQSVASSPDPQHLSNADRVASELLFLPMHAYLEEEQVARITHALGMMATHVPEGDYELDPE